MENIYFDIRHLADSCRFAEEHITFLKGQREKVINLKEEFLDCWLDEKVLGNPQHILVSKEVLIKELEGRIDRTKEELEINKEELAEVLNKYKEIYESR